MNIFESIENFSYMIADKIGYGDSEDNIELYRYSIFMIFSQFFTIDHISVFTYKIHHI